MSKGFSIRIFNGGVDISSHLSPNYDHFFYENNTFSFVLEGVILNKRELLKNFALKNFETLIVELFSRKKEKIIADLEGEFRGCIWDKKENKVFIFTNPTSTQPVYYSLKDNGFYADSSLVRLKKNLIDNGISVRPNLDSIYQLLCFGNMLENATQMDGIFKILDGHYIEICCSTLAFSEHSYFDLSAEGYFSKSKEKALEITHELFRNSVKSEYDKDSEYGTPHLSLLSGGLDSRVALFYALQENSVPDNVLCFSQSNYFDETISKKIAEDYRLHHEFIPLDGGIFLKNIDQLTEISEGNVFFTGGIHVHYALSKLQFENFSIFHSGQIGDGILGGFNTVPKRKSPTEFKIVLLSEFLPKVNSVLQKTLKRYDSEELFLMRNVGFNRTFLGAQVFQQKAYQMSPFMTKDFMRFAISLPENWKFQHRFYIDWISKYCKNATNYRWERTLLKPNAYWKTKFGDKILKRGYNAVQKHLLHSPQSISMYPYQYYFDNSVEIQKHYQEYFISNFHRIEAYPELMDDVKKLFESKDFFRKSQAINILSIFKLFFNE